jgi:hypothetical protein
LDVNADDPAVSERVQRIVVSDLEGMKVVSQEGEQLGKIDGVVESAADGTMYVVINHGGFIGLGEKRIALSAEGLLLHGEGIMIPGLTEEEIGALPEFAESEQFPRVERNAEAEFRVVAQQ